MIKESTGPMRGRLFQYRRGILRALLIVCSMLGPWAQCVHAEKFVIAWSAVSALNSPFWVMNDGGLLKQEGLDMELVYIASSPTVARATLAGDIVLSGANSQVIVDAGLNGADLVAMGAITNVVAFYIMAAPEIQKVTDLKGKVVGVTRFGASTDFGMRMLLAKYGLEAAKDAPFIQIGGMPELAAALSKKTVFAASMSQPMVYLAQKAGLHMLANLAKEDIPFMHIGLTTSRRWIREYRPAAKAFIRAYGRSIHFMHTRKEETRKIFAKYTKITDPAMIDGSIQYGYDFMEKISPGQESSIPGDARADRQGKPAGQTSAARAIFRQQPGAGISGRGIFHKALGKNASMKAPPKRVAAKVTPK